MVALLASVVTGGRVGEVGASSAPRIGFLNTSSWGEVADATRNLLDKSVRRLSAGGAQVHDLPAPPSMASLRKIQDVVFAWEMLQALAHERIFRRDDLKPRTKQEFEEYEQRLTPEIYETGLDRPREARRECADLFRDCDVLLVPAAVGEAPEGLDSTGDARFNGAWSMLQLPCLTLPMGRGPAGLPIGLQLVARRGEDATLLHAATFVEACLATYLAKGAHDVGLRVEPSFLTAAFVPIAVGVIWLVSYNIRKRHLKHDDGPSVACD